VAVDAVGDVYVCDSNNHRIQKFTGTGTYLNQWGSFGTGNGQFRYPYGVAVNAAGEIFVADFENYRIQKFGQGTTPAKSTTWGRIKSLYR
jgi:DNA-binding beta-propeller fold protein YncE